METRFWIPCFSDENSLNRTMQYGNKFKKIINKQNNNGLNRTMQYGNSKGFFQSEAQKAV